MRRSFPTAPAAPGAPAQGTADTRRDPTLSCGGRAGPSPLPCPASAHAQVLGVQCWHPRSPEHSHPLLPGTGTSPAGDRDLAPALPFPARQGCREGTSAAMLPWSFTPSPAQPSPGKEGGAGAVLVPNPPSPCTVRMGWAVFCSPGPGLGRAGATSLVLLPCCSHRAQLCYSASRAACSLNSSKQTPLLLGHGAGAAPEHSPGPQRQLRLGLRGQRAQIPGSPQCQRSKHWLKPRSSQLGWEHPSCRAPRHTIPSGKGCWALAPPAPGTPSSPGHFALVVRVQLGRHLRVHLAQAPVELSTVQLLQLHFPVAGRPGHSSGLLLRGTGQP